jgi:hypothetical protein
MNTDVFNVIVAVAIIGAALAAFGLLRVARWILWCVVRGYVRREIRAAARLLAGKRPRDAKGRFAR